MKLLLLLPLSLGLVSPAIAHNIQNTNCPPGYYPMCLTPSSCACMQTLVKQKSKKLVRN